MCTILQALRAAEAIAATQTLPGNVSVTATQRGVGVQGTFDNADALAAHLELHRHEEDDFTSEPRPHSPARVFTVWGGSYQNVPLTFVHHELATTEQEVAS